MRHLVLGGSEGIGKAYALYLAEKRDSLTIVARNYSVLEECREELLQIGAPSVDIIAGDLLDRSFRTQLRNTRTGFQSILLGGPSPPAGSLDTIDAESLRSASEIVLVYPYEMARWALSSALTPQGQLIVLSSSAVEESLCAHPFFLSALLRRTLHAMIECMAINSGRAVSFWKPRVVATRLAYAYATRSTGSGAEVDVLAFLKAAFEVDVVPTPSEWVKLVLDRSKSR